MNKTVILILLCGWWNMALSQTTDGEFIDFHVKNMPISEVIQLLSERTNIDISFSNRFFENKPPVTISMKQVNGIDILKHLLDGTGINFKLLDDQVVLYREDIPQKEKFTISGFIEDAETGEKLIGANVYIPKLDRGTITNAYGFFSISLPEGKQEIVFSYLGSEASSSILELRENTRLSIALEQSVTLIEVVVTPKNSASNNNRSSVTEDHLNSKMVKIQPELGGESDVIRTAMLLPGVQTGADGLGGLHVRGGNPDQNLMLLDGVPVYNASHLLGIFSIYNTNAIRSAKLVKGPFSARYGGRISSIFDVHTREGNLKRWSGEAAIGLVSFNGTVEGPFIKDRGSVLLTFRRTHSNFFLEQANQDIFYDNDRGIFDYHFYDLNFKANFAFSKRDNLFLSYYSGGDQFLFEVGQDYQIIGDPLERIAKYQYSNDVTWGNNIVSLRWNHLFSDKLFSNTTLTFSEYQFRNAALATLDIPEEVVENRDQYYFYDLFTDNQDFSGKIDFDYNSGPDHYIKFGFGLSHHEFTPEAAFVQRDTNIAIESLDLNDLLDEVQGKTYQGLQSYFYIEDQIRINDEITIYPGLRLSSFSILENRFFNVEPRFRADYRLSAKWLFVFGESRMVQYLHQINVSGLSTPDDVWYPANRFAPPQTSWQTDVGLFYSSANGMEFSVEAYHKFMDNIYALNDSIPFLSEDQQIDNEVVSGSGWGYGLEVMVKKDFKHGGGWISYSASWAERRYSSLNIGQTYPYSIDRRHMLHIFGYFSFLKNFSVSSTWTIGSANPRLIVSEEDFINNIYPIEVSEPGRKNEIRATPYHRLDLALTYALTKKRLKHQLKISLYNVFNRSNTAYSRLYNEDGEWKTTPVSVLPTVPSLSYQIRY
ncbi:MAG: carboxypeptidase-like regulatory domain-containing protein [Bacteroidota bacterium]